MSLAQSINLSNDNRNHNNISINGSSTPNISDINISNSNSSNIGLDLLMNENKLKGNSGYNDTKDIKITPTSNTSNNDDFNLDNLLGDNFQEIKLDNIDDNIFSLNSGNSASSVSSPSSTSSPNIGSKPIVEVKLNDLDNDLGSSHSVSTPSTFNIEDLSTNVPDLDIPPKKTYEEIQKEKFEILCSLERLEARGIKVSKTFTMESDFTEMKREFERITRKVEVDKSVRFQRKMLIAFVTAIEFMNTKFDPMDIKLDGWSESVHENLNDYDDIFEELHEKYKEKAQMAPELRLIIMLAGSGFMFHLTQTLFKSSLPGVGDIMKQNPDLMNQFAKAAANSMGEQAGLGNLMGDLMSERHNRGGVPSGNSGQRKEMRGPPNINDILGDVSVRKPNNRNIDLENLSNISGSDMENLKNVNLSRKYKKGASRGKNEITLDF
jgi:hypothetical protein